MSRDAAIAARLFLAFLLLYVGTAKGILEEVDDVAMLRVTQSLVQNHAVSVPPDTPGASVGLDGQSYTRYGLGQSLLGIPFFLLGATLPNNVQTHNVYDPHGFVLATPVAFAMTLLGALTTAASVALVFLTARALTYSTSAALLAAISLGLGTFAWFYARTFMTEPPSMLCALLAVYAILRFAHSAGTRWLVVSGAASGMLLLLRFGNAVLLPPLTLWLIWQLSRTPQSRVRAAAAWLAPILASLALIAIYNQVRFGSPLQTGYGAAAEAFTTPLALGLYGLLLSPGKSVFAYAPITVAGVIGWFTLRRGHAALAWTIAAMAAIYLVFYARYDWWYGGGPWGPRFLTVILPFAGLCVAALVDRPLRRPALLALAAVLVLSIAIQVVSILVPYLPYDATMEQDPVSFDRMLWHPAYSPLPVAIRALLHGTYPLDLAFSYFNLPWLAWLQAALTIAGVAGIITCLRQPDPARAS